MPADWLFQYNALHWYLHYDSPLFTLLLYGWLIAGCYWVASPRSRDIGLGTSPAYLLLLPNALLPPLLLLATIPAKTSRKQLTVLKGAIGVFTILLGILLLIVTANKLQPNWLQFSSWYVFGLVSIPAGFILFRDRSQVAVLENGKTASKLQTLDTNLIQLSYLLGFLGILMIFLPINPMDQRLGSSFILSGLYLWYILKRANITQRIRNFSILMLAIVSAALPSQLHTLYNGSSLFCFLLIGASVRRWWLIRKNIKTDNLPRHAR